MAGPRGAARAIITLLGTVLAAVLALVVATPATAASTDPVSISALQVDGATITGVLSVSQSAAITVDDTTLNAVIAARHYPVKITATTDVKRATMIVVDTSGSMGSTGMSTVREAVATFLKEVPADVAVGLTAFADKAKVVVPPTKDRATVSAAVATLRSSGETSLYDGIITGAKAMSGYDSRTMVLLSDGGDTVSKDTQAAAAKTLKDESVWTAVVGFHTADSDNSVLSSFANASGNTVAAATSPAAVKAAFLASAKALTSQIVFTVTPGPEAADGTSLIVSGQAGGRIFQTQVPLTMPADAWPGRKVTSDKVVVQDESGSIIPAGSAFTFLTVGIGAVGLGLFVLVIALSGSALRSSSSQRVEAIERYLRGAGSGPGGATSSMGSGSPSAFSEGLVRIGDKVMENRDSTPKTMRLIERADIPIRPGEWWVLRLIAVFLGASLMFFFFRGGFWFTLSFVGLGTLVGYLLPSVILRYLARRRSKKFEAQLPDILMLLASSLSTGFSLSQALDAVAKDAPEPLAKEFSRALAETRIGADLSEALERLSDRMESTNMRWTAMAIRIQREVGGNLAETLRTTAGTLREREGLQRHVRALSAEGRLSAYILIAMPIGIFFYLLKINHDYVAMLWTRPMGVGMLVAGIVFMGIGIAWLNAVVKVEV
jgi:tight adherence protein B